MILLLTIPKARKALVERLRGHRVSQGLTQVGLAQRAGVSLATLRKFEQKGLITLEGYLKLAFALGILDRVVDAVSPAPPAFKSIEEVLMANRPEPKRKRGWRS